MQLHQAAKREPSQVADPYAAVQVDVAALQGADGLPDGMACVGMVYNVNTGLIETAVAPE
jgi:carbonic anhydrase